MLKDNINRQTYGKKEYHTPKVTRVALDNSISLVMMTTAPSNPQPRPRNSNRDRSNDPFESPFDNGSF